MTVNISAVGREEYTDALYSALRARDVHLTWSELDDALREAAVEVQAYEYGVKYSLSEEAHGEGKFGYYWAPSYSHAAEDARDSGGTVVRRTKAGEWEEVET